MGDLFQLKWGQLEKQGIGVIESKSLIEHMKDYWTTQ
jgi:hypothetical protein